MIFHYGKKILKLGDGATWILWSTMATMVIKRTYQWNCTIKNEETTRSNLCIYAWDEFIQTIQICRKTSDFDVTSIENPGVLTNA